MALLAKTGSSTWITLAAHGLVGRSSACQLRVDVARASAEHARLAYRDGAWSVRDLGSKNGTFVNGERLEPGGARALVAGDRLAFGDPAVTFTLVDASPPVAMARPRAGGALLVAERGVLALPSPEDPRVSVFEREHGEWVAEIDGAARPVHDGDVLEVGGDAFTLYLPMPVAATVEERGRPAGIEDVELRLRVSKDEETVELTVVQAADARVLPPRSHHYMLLTLARARARDRDARGLVDPQRGWLGVDELCRMLGADENKLNVEIYRVRQELGALGLANAASIIERRRGSRQLRIGTERVTIHID